MRKRDFQNDILIFKQKLKFLTRIDFDIKPRNLWIENT